MSSGADHDRFSESLAAYALGALAADQGEHLREHLAGCPECRAELDWLRAAVDVLPASVVQIEPPPELKANVMAVVESEASLLRAAGEAAERPARPPRRPWWSGAALTSSPVRIAAALAVAAVTVLVLVVPGGGPGTRTIRAQVRGAAGAAGARASLRLRGQHGELVVTGLPTVASNHVDELWVQHGSGTPVPAGTFVLTTGSVAVARPIHSGDHVLVTVEPGGGSGAPTTAPFIVARA